MPHLRPPLPLVSFAKYKLNIILTEYEKVDLR